MFKVSDMVWIDLFAKGKESIRRLENGGMAPMTQLSPIIQCSCTCAIAIFTTLAINLFEKLPVAAKTVVKTPGVWKTGIDTAMFLRRPAKSGSEDEVELATTPNIIWRNRAVSP